MRFGKIESTIVTLCSDIFKHAFVRRCSPSTTQEKSEPLSIGKRFGFFRLPYFLPRHFHFQSQQRGFFIDAACISGQSAVCSDNAVAGNDDRDHIVSDSPAHSLRRHPEKAAFCSQLLCQCTIGRGLAAGDAAQQRPHLLLKGRASGMERRGRNKHPASVWPWRARRSPAPDAPHPGCGQSTSAPRTRGRSGLCRQRPAGCHPEGTHSAV